MTNDLDEALAEAERVAATVSQLTRPDTPHGLREGVYVLEGCDCLQQGGRDYRYHIHTFSPAGYFAWHATQAQITLIKQIDC